MIKMNKKNFYINLDKTHYRYVWSIGPKMTRAAHDKFAELSCLFKLSNSYRFRDILYTIVRFF